MAAWIDCKALVGEKVVDAIWKPIGYGLGDLPQVGERHCVRIRVSEWDWTSVMAELTEVGVLQMDW